MEKIETVKISLMAAYLPWFIQLLMAVLPHIYLKDKPAGGPNDGGDEYSALTKLLARIALAFGGMSFVWFVAAVLLG